MEQCLRMWCGNIVIRTCKDLNPIIVVVRIFIHLGVS
jgi:hypothetical protein